MSREAPAYWVDAPGKGSIRHGKIAGIPGGLFGRTLFSGISCGTERLVGNGRVPEESRAHMACRYMEGSFALPVKYGYCLVGRTVDGRLLFTMHPHQARFGIHPDHAVFLPEAVPARRGLLFPFLETALNAVWDAQLTEEETIGIVGGGLIGILVAFVIHTRTGHAVSLHEKDANRHEKCGALPWVNPIDRGTSPSCLFHCSGTSEGLQWAIDRLAFEGRVIELSWHGDQPVTLNLGGSFHHGRKRIISSQVSTLAAPVRDGRTLADRTRTVLALLGEESLDRLLGPELAFSELPEFMGKLYKGNQAGWLPVVNYEEYDE